jgi:hypothetical protein
VSPDLVKDFTLKSPEHNLTLASTSLSDAADRSRKQPDHAHGCSWKRLWMNIAPSAIDREGVSL